MELIYPGFIFTASVSFLLSFFSFFVAFTFSKEAKGKKAESLFSIFLYLFALLWFMVGMRHLAGSFDLRALDIAIFYANQVVVFAHMVPLGYYIYSKTFKSEKFALAAGFLFVILAILGSIFLFIDGITIGPSNNFTTEYGPGGRAELIFKVMFILAVPLFLIHFIRLSFDLLKGQRKINFPFYFINTAVVIYALLGYFDEIGILLGWKLVLFRLFYLLCMFFVYISVITSRTEEL